MDYDWFNEALREDDGRTDGADLEDEECPVCGDEAGYSCPCVRD